MNPKPPAVVALSVRLVAAVGFLLVAIGVTSWGLISANHANAPHVQAPRSSASASPGPITLPSLIPRGWRLAFDPSFTGSRLNRKVWDTCYPWANAKVIGCSNFGHKEYQWYMPGQDKVSHGLLELVARRQPTTGISPTGNRLHYSCRSGIVTTFHSFRFEYGAVQVVARMPQVIGMWPALWLAAANKHFPPEIDIVEHWVRPQYQTGVFLHSLGGERPYNYPQTANLAVGWHTFTIVWTSHRAEWLIDGKIALVATRGIPHQPMYFIANLANARSPSRGGCGGTFSIRSVRIWLPPGARTA